MFLTLSHSDANIILFLFIFYLRSFVRLKSRLRSLLRATRCPKLHLVARFVVVLCRYVQCASWSRVCNCVFGSVRAWDLAIGIRERDCNATARTQLFPIANALRLHRIALHTWARILFEWRFVYAFCAHNRSMSSSVHQVRIQSHRVLVHWRGLASCQEPINAQCAHTNTKTHTNTRTHNALSWQTTIGLKWQLSLIIVKCYSQ